MPSDGYLLEIEIEIVHRLRPVVADARAWATYIVDRSPNDVAARLGMTEAIKRRFATATQGPLAVTRVNAGRFEVAGSRPLPYDVRVWGTAPGAASCNCRDFLRASLGLCKHVAAVRSRAEHGVAEAPVLDWDPIRPWTTNDPPHGRLELRVPTWYRSDHPWVATRPGVLRLGSAPADEALARYLRELVDHLGERVSPAARAVVDELVRNVEERERLLANAASCVGARAKRELFPYQRVGVERLLTGGALLLGDDMGLGKTTQAIAGAVRLLEARVIDRALFVVPAALKTQWAREWAAVTDEPVRIVEGHPTVRRRLFASTERGALLVNYEQVLRDADAICTWKPDLVVLDEAQRIKNWASKTAVVMKAFRPRYRWALTGTPFENRLDELASLLDWIDDHALEPKWRLDCFHAERADGATTVVGAKHLRTLRERIAHCVLRRTREEVLQELPERTNVSRVVPMVRAQHEAHAALDEAVARLLGSRDRRSLSAAEFLQLMKLLNRQRMISNAAILPDDEAAWRSLANAPPQDNLRALGSPKLEELRELVRELAIERREKIAIFTQWRRMAKWAHWAVRDLLVAAKLDSGFFTGAEPEARRRENVIRFHDDPDFRVLFLTDAGGVGLNLQRAASVMINLEYPWNPAVLEQRIGRIHRFEQNRPVQIYLLSSSEGIESRITSLVGNKSALFRGVFDDARDAVAFVGGGSFLTRLERVLPASAPRRDAVPSASSPPPTVTPTDPFASVKLSTLPSGELRIEAPKESAALLAPLLRQMADLLAKLT